LELYFNHKDYLYCDNSKIKLPFQLLPKQPAASALQNQNWYDESQYSLIQGIAMTEAYLEK
jgi:hypothetical protein